MENHLKHLPVQKPSIPFIGNLIVQFLTAKNISEFLENFNIFTLQNETPLKASLGPIYNVVLDKPEDVKTVLMSQQCLDKPYTYNFFQSRNGLIGQRCKTTHKEYLQTNFKFHN